MDAIIGDKTSSLWRKSTNFLTQKFHDPALEAKVIDAQITLVSSYVSCSLFSKIGYEKLVNFCENVLQIQNPSFDGIAFEFLFVNQISWNAMPYHDLIHLLPFC